MMDRESLLALAAQLTREAFADRFRHPFVTRPVTADPERQGHSFEWETNIRAFERDGSAMVKKPKEAELDYLEVTPAPTSAYRDRVWIGRTSNCEITLEDKSVSKLHAYLTYDKGEASWFIVDARSGNGVYVNGTRVESMARAKVAFGDKIRFGSVETTFLDAAQLYDRLKT